MGTSTPVRGEDLRDCVQAEARTPDTCRVAPGPLRDLAALRACHRQGRPGLADGVREHAQGALCRSCALRPELLFPRSRDAALRRGRAGVPGPRLGAPRALQHRGSRRTAPLPPRAAAGLSPPTPSFLATGVLAHSGHSRPLAPHLLDRPAKTTTPGKGRGRGRAPPASCRPPRGSRGCPPPPPTPPWLGRAGRRGGARPRRAGLAPAPGAPGSAAESRLRLRDARGGRGDRRRDRRVSTGPGIGDEWGAAGEEGAARGPRE